MSDMFDIPNAKRVRRDELYGSSSDAGSRSHSDAEEDAEVRAKLNERLSSLLGLDFPSMAAPAPENKVLGDGDGDQGEKQDEEFEFRLFSTSSKTAAPVRVVLAASDDEDAPKGQGAFTVAERPTSYYLAGEPTREQVELYRQTALSGEDILLGARKRAWGLERPWRIVRLGTPGKATRGVTDKGPHAKATIALPLTMDVDESLKRKRPGKKRRIKARIKVKAEKEKREAEESKKLTKEEHLKEKKKRLNREKKLKRRAKEKGQKLAGKSASEPADSGSDDESVA